jgi:hypothetical protein
MKANGLTPTLAVKNSSSGVMATVSMKTTNATDSNVELVRLSPMLPTIQVNVLKLVPAVAETIGWFNSFEGEALKLCTYN